jgi:hypothetical protein
VFWQGALTNVLNPKVALFFLAFLPQFVAVESAHKTLAFLALGLIFITSGTLWCFGLAAFAARAAGRIRQSAGAMAWVNRALGGCSSISASASRCSRRARFGRPDCLEKFLRKELAEFLERHRGKLRHQFRKRIAGEIDAENNHADLEPAPKDIRLQPRPYRLSDKHAGKGRCHGYRAGQCGCGRQ